MGQLRVHLSNVEKVFWPEFELTKGDLLAYYATVSRVLLPHITGRAMVMKRHPDGASGKFFFMKRTPQPKPPWLRTCAIEHASGNVIDFPVVDGIDALLWIVNLGCIDLNPWYARCDEPNRPDFLHFDLDPVPGAKFDKARNVALLVRDAPSRLGMPTAWQPLAPDQVEGSRRLPIAI